MQTRTKQTQRSRHRNEVYGKCQCVSFALHEVHLIDELEKLADAEYMTKSAYIKRFIRSEARKQKEQNKNIQRAL